MPGDFLNDDIDTMLSVTEFGSTVTWTDQATSTATEIKGIFDASYIDIDPISGETVNVDPQIVVKTNDVTGLKQGDTITVGTTVYNIKRHVLSDSDNTTTLILNEVV